MEKRHAVPRPFPAFRFLATFLLVFLPPPLAAVLTSVVCQREEAEVHLKLMFRTVIVGPQLTMQDRQRVPI